MARPRSFEPAEALSHILNVFWEKGYEGASLQDLEAATGLNKQSLYRAFGDKRAMYLAALDMYERTEIACGADLLREGGSAADRIQRLFEDAIRHLTEGHDRRGCFVGNASVDQASLDTETETRVRNILRRLQEAIESALAVSPPYDEDAALRRRRAMALLAGYMGLRVLIKVGMGEAELRDVMDATLAPIRQGEGRI